MIVETDPPVEPTYGRQLQPVRFRLFLVFAVLAGGTALRFMKSLIETLDRTETRLKGDFRYRQVGFR